ncbi:MAG: hypothetical protein V3T77_03960 [Planctomycetota bacterium]
MQRTLMAILVGTSVLTISCTRVEHSTARKAPRSSHEETTNSADGISVAEANESLQEVASARESMRAVKAVLTSGKELSREDLEQIASRIEAAEKQLNLVEARLGHLETDH